MSCSAQNNPLPHYILSYITRYSILVHCILLYSTLQYVTLYWTILSNNRWNCTLLNYNKSYQISLYPKITYYITSYNIMSHHTISYVTSYNIMSHHTISYYTISHNPILSYIILSYRIICNTVEYCYRTHLQVTLSGPVCVLGRICSSSIRMQDSLRKP